MIVLGIETSCDETAAGVVHISDDLKCTLLSNVVSSSIDLHVAYGGVVPEIAARSHLEVINPVIERALDEAQSKVAHSEFFDQQLIKLTSNKNLINNDSWSLIDAIAVTYGAGLGGCLLVGVMTARTLAIIKNKLLYGVNHVEGHVYANFLTSNIDNLEIKSSLPSKLKSESPTHRYHLPTEAPTFPILALIVSGGHSQLVLFRDHFDYTLLGQTHDDAIGEAFDKVAKVIGLPYPGGPSIAVAAANGNSRAFNFPKSRMEIPSLALIDLRESIRFSTKMPKNSFQGSQPLLKSYDFSFSGIKTAVLRTVQQLCDKPIDFPSYMLADLLNNIQRNNIAASFQRIAVETVVDKTVAAYFEFLPRSVVIAGGVAANQELRRQLAQRIPIEIEFSDPILCTDNGAMIATLGAFKAILSQPTSDPYTLAPNPNLSM